jgi:hypothetical protein
MGMVVLLEQVAQVVRVVMQFTLIMRIKQL